ncbi:hypothetical protein UVI_02064010 [Ustilaginoidea virens]|uniref:Postreplication repair E3 ubiquitin-protein ligase RAD18 n=1 Tax=Ustilaginoidea virens TaxID=1159556 RepID=A0A1B5L7Y6_USTVR|nr:hypothetical protein UVI_02064010 [Ustilaginoidea virens]
MLSDNVADSTDWLETSLAPLAAVEAALRCQVCKDFYNTPMITSCSHTFCSICIRRALSNDGKCPLCRAPEQELKLRSNWSLEETVEAFSRARPAALALGLKTTRTGEAPKRKAGDDETVCSSGKTVIGSKQDSPKEAQHIQVVPASDDDDDEVSSEGSGDHLHDGRNVDDLVPCPSCQMKMKAWQVFQHLEACPGPKSQETRSSQLETGSNSHQKLQLRQSRSIQRLPPLNYSMMKEQALRKKLNEIGISNQGPRILLEMRHKEWLAIWNANCDSARPKKRSQLLHDLDVWEKAQGYRQPNAARAALNAVAIKDTNFDGAAWAAKHGSSFKDLVATARKNKAPANEETKAPDKRPEQEGFDERAREEICDEANKSDARAFESAKDVNCQEFAGVPLAGHEDMNDEDLVQR